MKPKPAGPIWRPTERPVTADERLKPKEVARRAQEMAPGWSAKELYELLTRA